MASFTILGNFNIHKFIYFILINLAISVLHKHPLKSFSPHIVKFEEIIHLVINLRFHHFFCLTFYVFTFNIVSLYFLL